MNTHNSMWNSHYCPKQNAGSLKQLIETYKLIINNDTDFPTRPLSHGLLIIDLALTNIELGFLRL